MELRSSGHAAEYLARNGFHERAATVAGLFMDSRCGLISSELIGAAVPAARGALVRRVLDCASACHAHGMIVATNDLHGKVAASPEWHELTASLFSKGEAMGVTLLNHLVLTDEGWKAISPARQASRRTAVGASASPMQGDSADLRSQSRGNPHPAPENKAPPIPFAPRQTGRG